MQTSNPITNLSRMGARVVEGTGLETLRHVSLPVPSHTSMFLNSMTSTSGLPVESLSVSTGPAELGGKSGGNRHQANGVDTPMEGRADTAVASM